MPQSLHTDVEFRRFFGEYFGEVRSYCLRRLPAADAAEAVSEVFVVVWRKRDSIPDEVRPWLFAIARNVVRNQVRSRVRADRLLTRARREPAYPVPGPEAVVIRNAADEALLDAVRSLPEKYAEAVRLWAWESLSARQIATVVGCSQAAAEKRLTRGLQKMRETIGQSTNHVSRKAMGLGRRFSDER